MAEAGPIVGTLREKPLHAALKRWCAEPGDRFEEPVGGFVIDVARPDLLIEIQTSSFSKMKRKLISLLDAGHAVRVVYPIPADKTIVKMGEGGEILSTRRSPKHGRPIDVFGELVSFPTLIDEPGFELQVVVTREREIRRHRPGKSWRRRGWVTEERQLVEVVDWQTFRCSEDLATLLPIDLPDPFTTAELASALGRPKRLAQQMTYCLRNTGAIVATGKRGNAIEYRRSASPGSDR